MKLRIWGLLALGGILLLCCAKPTSEAGGGSDTPNPPACAVQGVIVLDSQVPAIGKEGVFAGLYHIVAEDTNGYEWFQVDQTLTDTSGAFGFDSLDTGYYSILLHKDIYKAFTGYFHYGGNDSVVDLDTITIGKAKDISGVIESRDPYTSLVLSLVGTPYSDTVGNGQFLLNGIPLGNYTMEIFLESISDSTDHSSNFINKPPVSDTNYVVDNSNLPINGAGQVDSVTIVSDSIEISSDNFNIKYTITDH